MTCRACGAALVPGARFCATCGAPVELSCTVCGGPIPPSGRFCPACGTPVASGSAAPASGEERPAPQRERKVATLLFADLVGFTSLGESHDPEVVGAIVSQVFARLGAEIARYEGTIEKHAGDAMLAVFGVPSIHEDDPERAVRAALEMQGAMVELAAELRAADRPETSLRIGIETGEVLADLSRLGGERDLFVTGDAVNTAARLQQAAAPGSVVVGPATYAATRDVVEYEELPPTALKGKAIPVAAWRAVAVKARRGGARTPLGIESPVVGRDAEIAILKETVRRTVADGRPHLVTVIGAAGVGKSRLTWELEKYLDGLPETFHWRKGRCLAYAQASYSALADAIKADARILDDDAPSTAIAKLDDRIEEVHGAAPDPAIATALQAVLALGPIGTLPRDALFEAWRRHLDAVARIAPLVLVLEDIHWADEGLLDVIEFLARWGEGPVTIICLARHELLERRPGWGGGMLNAATIVLEPLDDEESTRLVDGLLGDGVPADLRERIVGLADGNPLFAEELVRMFVDRGVLRTVDGRWELAAAVDDVEVPGSIQAVLAARLDGLPAAEKRLAQQAAVVGRIFWDAVVAHLSRQGRPATIDLLRRLRVKELVVPREPSSLAGASEYGFRHVLIRDVAYDSLAKRDRASLHLDVARWAEEALADRRDELVEILAAHYVAALRYEEEFGAGPDRDLRTLRRAVYDHAKAAGARATSLYQLEAATGWHRVAIEEAKRLDLPPRERAQLAEDFNRGGTGHAPADELLAVIEEGIGLLSGLPDRTPDDEQLLGRLRAASALYLFNLDRLDEARAVLEEGIAALEDGPPSHARGLLLARLGWTYWRGGPVAKSMPLLRRAVEEARAIGDRNVEAWALHELAVAISLNGDPGESVELILESYRLARELKDGTLLARCLNNVPSTMWTNGSSLAEVEPILQEGLERSRRSGDLGSLAWQAQTFADCLVESGFPRRAIPLYKEAAAASRAQKDDVKLSVQILALAEVDILMGQGEDAVRRRSEVAARLKGWLQHEPQAEIFDHMWDAGMSWPDDPTAAIARLRSAVEAAETQQGRLDGARLLARMAFRTMDADTLRWATMVSAKAASKATGVHRILDRRWVSALQGDDSSAAPLLAAVAADREAAGAPLPAADAYADAALAAARAQLPSTEGYVQEALRLYAVSEVVPLMGLPPEVRWIERHATGVVSAPVDRPTHPQ